MDFLLLKKTTIEPRQDRFYEIFREYFSMCNFFQYMSMYCKATALTKSYEKEAFNVIDENDLNLFLQHLRYPRAMEVLGELTKVIPNVPKITLATGNFLVGVSQVLTVLAGFEKVRELIIFLDEGETEDCFPVFFKELESLTLRQRDYCSYNQRRNADWILNSITASCQKLKNVYLRNMIFSNSTCARLIKSGMIESIVFINIEFEVDEKLLAALFLSNNLKNICLRENYYGNKEKNFKATKAFFETVKENYHIQKLSITVFSGEGIPYENLIKLRNLQKIVIYLPHRENETIRKNFNVIAHVLKTFENKKLKIEIVRMDLMDLSYVCEDDVSIMTFIMFEQNLEDLERNFENCKIDKILFHEDFQYGYNYFEPFEPVEPGFESEQSFTY